MTSLILPGMIDAHVHLRDPGGTQKEDAYSGTLAALAGGVVGVLDMPNNQPPTVDAQALKQKQEALRAKAVCDYGLFIGFDGQDIAPLAALAGQVVGLKLYLDETFGDMTTAEPAMLAQVFEAWPGPGPIAVHAESPSIQVALRLAQRYGQQLHVCHVPHPDDLLHIEDARQAGVQVTCEVTPHHLLLSTEDAARLGPYGQMKPPLLAPHLVSLYWERLDLVDMIASDHAPHTRAEKEAANPPPGVPGVETTMPLLVTAVEQGRLDLDRLIDLIHITPLEVYGLAAPPDTHVELEVGHARRLSDDGYITRCGWSPFAGQTVLAQVVRTTLRGQVAWSQGLPLVAPGHGQPLMRRRNPL